MKRKRFSILFSFIFTPTFWSLCLLLISLSLHQYSVYFPSLQMTQFATFFSLSPRCLPICLDSYFQNSHFLILSLSRRFSFRRSGLPKTCAFQSMSLFSSLFFCLLFFLLARIEL